MLDVTGMEVAQDGKWFHGQGSWCKFDSEQMVEHMRTIHRKKQDGSLGLNVAGIETAKGLTWKNTTNQLWAAIETNRAWTDGA